jgi:restriction system protein
MAAERAVGGYVVTSGTFTKDARKFAVGRNIELMDGEALDVLLKTAGTPDAETKAPKSIEAVKKVEAPVCPKCRTPMVARVAKQGRNAGGRFWGCAQFPRCRETVAGGG